MHGNQEAPISKVVDSLNNGGDAKVELLKLGSVQNNQGCAQHPDKAAQQAMGELLASRVRAVMNW